MTTTGISSIAIQTLSSNILSSQKTELEKLNEQLASGVQNDDLTDYTPSDALNLMNFQNSITQRQGYLSSIQTVQTRLSLYDSTMSDMESITQLASSLAAQSSTYDSTKIASIQSQVNSYLQQTQDDLNQQIGGRYIYAGSRYNTAPVSNLEELTAGVSYPFTASTSPSLPAYDVGNADAVSATVSGQNITYSGTVQTPQNVSVTVDGTTYTYAAQSSDGNGVSSSVSGNNITFSGAVNTPQNVSVNYAGKTYTYAVQSGDTTTSIASGLATQISADIPGTTSSGGTLSIGDGTVNTAVSGQNITFSGTINSPQNVSVTVGSTTYTYAVQSGDTATSIASALVTQMSADIPGTSSAGGVLTVGGTTAPTVAASIPSPTVSSSVSNDTSLTSIVKGLAALIPGASANGTTLTIGSSDTIDGTDATLTSTAAYTQDSATVDTGYSVQYGVTSNDPAFQQLIAGLQLMKQATQQTDSTTYQTMMNNAASLLSTALTSLQTVHSSVAANQNLMDQETTTQNTNITNLQDQITNIQSVDTSTVATEITSLQAQLEASYSATGSILKLSLVNYL